MGLIGGLDVGFGAQLGIVDTTVAIIESINTTALTMQNSKRVLQHLQQGMPSHLAPDMVYFGGAAAGAIGTSVNTNTDFQTEVRHFSGYTEGTNNATQYDMQGVVRHIGQVPVQSGAAHASNETAIAMGTKLGVQGRTLVDNAAHGSMGIVAVLSAAAVSINDFTMDTVTDVEIVYPLSGTESSNDVQTFDVVGAGQLVHGVNADNLNGAAMRECLAEHFGADDFNRSVGGNYGSSRTSTLDLTGIALAAMDAGTSGWTADNVGLDATAGADLDTALSSLTNLTAKRGTNLDHDGNTATDISDLTTVLEGNICLAKVTSLVSMA